MLAALLAGVLPAPHAARANRGELLKDASRGTSSRRLGRVMGRLIGAEMAVSFVLLIAAGLFVRSALNLRTQPFTFAPQDVLVSSVRIADDRHTDVTERGALVRRLEAALAGAPTATSAAITTVVPGLGAPRTHIVVEGVHDPAERDLHGARSIAVTPAFFKTFMAPVLAGRAFDARDRAGALPVAIVNRAFERAYLPGGAVPHGPARRRSMQRTRSTPGSARSSSPPAHSRSFSPRSGSMA